jgi:hypothetical protein
LHAIELCYVRSVYNCKLLLNKQHQKLRCVNNGDEYKILEMYINYHTIKIEAKKASFGQHVPVKLRNIEKLSLDVHYNNRCSLIEIYDENLINFARSMAVALMTVMSVRS